MNLLFLILIIIAAVALGFFVLVQNPKGGGLAGNIAGFSNQFMGVKQTNDVLEKGTWIFAIIVGVLCMVSVLFINGSVSNDGTDVLDKLNPGTSATPPAQMNPSMDSANTVPMLPVDSTQQ